MNISMLKAQLYR